MYVDDKTAKFIPLRFHPTITTVKKLEGFQPSGLGAIQYCRYRKYFLLLWFKTLCFSVHLLNDTRASSWTKSRQKSEEFSPLLFHNFALRFLFIGWKPDKSLKSFPPCYSQSPPQLCLEISISSNSRNLLPEKKGKPDRKPYPPPLYGLRNPYRNLKSENSQDYSQKEIFMKFHVHEFGFCLSRGILNGLSGETYMFSTACVCGGRGDSSSEIIDILMRV